MSSKISTIMVSASVMLSCLAMLLLTVSGDIDSQDTKKSESANHEKETRFKNCHNRAGRDAVGLDCIKGLERIFKTVRDELATIPQKDEKGCGKEPKHHSSIIDVAYKEIKVIWGVLLDDVFGNIPSDHPLDSSKIKNESIYQMQNLADAVFTGIAVARYSRSSTRLTELQLLQNRASCSLKNMGSTFFVEMQVGRKCDAKTDAAVDHYLKKTVGAGLDSIRNMFNAFRILMAAVESGAKDGIDDDLAVLRDILKEENRICVDWAQHIFDSVDLLCRVRSKEYV